MTARATNRSCTDHVVRHIADQKRSKYYDMFREIRDGAEHCNNVSSLRSFADKADALKIRLMNEMDKLYNAASSKGYEPLTSEEKDAMTDDEVEKWETKIKDSLLRGDSELDTISSAMRQAMLSTFDIDGKTYSLSSFGINTLGYFEAADNEKNVEVKRDMYLNFLYKIRISACEKEEKRILALYSGASSEERTILQKNLQAISDYKDQMKNALGRL